jgi:type III restriction enzyme
LGESFPSKIILSDKEPEKFKKNLYEGLGKLNKEELNFISRIDSEELPNIKCWVRNREKKDFYLQGWKRNKFYPDFIALTKSGKTILLEWKGEDRVSNEDTRYKVEIAKEWEKVSNGKTLFFLVNTANIENILSQIKDV